MQNKTNFFFFLILPESLSFKFLPSLSLKNLYQLNKQFVFIVLMIPVCIMEYKGLNLPFEINWGFWLNPFWFG